MTKTKIVVGAGLAIFFVLSTGVFTAGFLAKDKKQAREAFMDPGPEPVHALVDPVLDSAEVSKHNTKDDCWLVISGNVYNLTKFLAQHPGGSKPIIPYCGADGTKAFATKDLNPARGHSKLAEELMAQYLVGKLGEPMTPQPGALPNIVGPLPTAVPPLAKAKAPGVLLPTPVSVLPVSSGTLTAADVARHSSTGDCWLIISGGVYDVTGFIMAHPGGVGPIATYCGKDATSAFSSKDQSPARNHSSYAYGLLSQYLIGNIGSPLAQLPPTAVPTQPINNFIPTVTPRPQSFQPTPTQVPQQGGSMTITTQEVALHNTSQNCWLIISGKVYNVTSYIFQHPGGSQVIISRCGTEATTAFNTKGQTGGSGHSGSAQNILASYLVGNLGSTVPVNPPSSGPAATPVPGQPTIQPTSPPVSGGNSCTNGVLPGSVTSKYPGATIKKQSIEDNCSQELEIIVNGQCRHIKTNSSGSITEDKSC